MSDIYTGTVAPESAEDGDIFIQELPAQPDTHFWDTAAQTYYEALGTLQTVINTLRYNGQVATAAHMVSIISALSEVIPNAVPEEARERIDAWITEQETARKTNELHEFGRTILGLSEEEMAAMDAAIEGGDISQVFETMARLAEARDEDGPSTVESETADLSA